MTTPYMQNKYSLLQQRRERKRIKKKLNNKQAQRQYTFEKLKT